MKTSLPLLSFTLCNLALAILGSFQIGVLYAAKPYRAWFANSSNGLEFTQIGVQQSHTLLLVAYAAVGCSFCGIGCLLFHLFRRKEPIQWTHSTVLARGQS